MTDNDGNIVGLENKYADYIKNNKKSNIKICYYDVVDSGNLTIGEKPYNYNTLEPKLLKANSNDVSILDKKFETVEELQKYMKHHKTETALAIFDTDKDIVFPQYILEAIKDE